MNGRSRHQTPTTKNARPSLRAVAMLALIAALVVPGGAAFAADSSAYALNKQQTPETQPSVKIDPCLASVSAPGCSKPTPTPTPMPPTATPTPKPKPPTATPTQAPTETPIPPTKTPKPPTATPVPPTATPEPTDTPAPPTSTPVPPTATPVPPTATLAPPTATPVPTATLVPPTSTPVPPTATPVPPTATPVPPTATPEPLTGQVTGDPINQDQTGEQEAPEPPAPTPTSTPPTSAEIAPTATPTSTSVPAVGQAEQGWREQPAAAAEIAPTPDIPAEIVSPASKHNPTPFVLLVAILFALAAAAAQALRNNPFLLQRMMRGFDGMRRGACPNQPIDAQVLDAQTSWPTLVDQPTMAACPSIDPFDAPFSGVAQPSAPAGGSLGGGHGGAAKSAPTPGASGFEQVVPNGFGQAVPNGGQIGGSHGGPGLAHGGLGGQTGFASHGAPSGGPSGSLGSIGGQHGGTLASAHVSNYASAPAANPVGSCPPMSDPASVTLQGVQSLTVDAAPVGLGTAGLGSGGLAACDLARDATATLVGRALCPTCTRKLEPSARFCGYCGKALPAG